MILGIFFSFFFFFFLPFPRSRKCACFQAIVQVRLMST